MLKDKKVIVFGLLAYFLCLYITFIFYSPVFSINTIKQAFKQQNVDILDDYIDFNSIRSSVVAQLKAELILKASEHNSQSEEPHPQFMAKVSHSIKMVEDFSELLFSKKGLSRLFQMAEDSSQEPESLYSKKYVSSLQSESFMSNDEFELKSLGTIEVNGYSHSGKLHRLIFTFRYTRWILTDIIFDLRDADSKDIVSFIKGFQ